MSIFSYTALMDRHWIAIPFELIKCSMGLFLILNYKDLLHISESLQLDTLTIYGYLLISLLITFFYTIYKKEKTNLTYF